MGDGGAADERVMSFPSGLHVRRVLIMYHTICSLNSDSNAVNRRGCACLANDCDYREIRISGFGLMVA